MDKRWIEKGFSRQSGHYASVSQVQMQMSKHLCSLLDHIAGFTPQTILEFGAGTGNLTLALQEYFTESSTNLASTSSLNSPAISPSSNSLVSTASPASPNPPQHWLLLDISRPMLEHHQRVFQNSQGVQKYRYIQADIEKWPWPAPAPNSSQSPDLLTSNATLQWLEDLPGLFQRFAQSMKSGSYGLIGTFGPQTLTELHQSYFVATGHPLDSEAQFISAETLEAIVQKSGFELLASDVREFPQHHPDTADLLHTLKHMGVTRTSRNSALNRQGYRRLTEHYQQNFSSEHGVFCTWQGVFVLFRKV
jgi:malonyl-CoA O-methyltransferase